MANLLYPLFKQRLLSPGIDLSSVTLRAVLVDTGTYTYSAAHDAYDDLAGVVGTESGTLGSKTFTNGVFDCADATFTAVTGATAEAVVIFVDSGTASTDSVSYTHLDVYKRQTYTVRSLTSAGTNMYLGNDEYSEWLNGRMAHVKIWNVALTAAEIQQEMYSSRPQRFTNLWSWLPMIESGSGRNSEWSSSGNTWTANGTLADEDGPPVAWNLTGWQLPFVTSGGAAGQTLLPARIESTATVYSPTLQPGAVTIQPARIESTAIVYEPTVSQTGAAQTLLPEPVSYTHLDVYKRQVLMVWNHNRDRRCGMNYVGLAIELKRSDRSNHATNEQVIWLEYLAAQGFRCEICYGLSLIHI